MAIDSFVMSLLLILVIGRLLAELSFRFSWPSVVGEVTAGILIGPSLLGWVTPHETLAIIAELGVILLLFDIGCETSIKKLLNAGPKVIWVALIGILAPATIMGLASAYWLSLSAFGALFFGCTLTATSIGISVHVLKLNGQDQSPTGQVILGAAVIDDIVGVALLSILFHFAASGEIAIGPTLLLIAMISGFVAFSPPIARGLVYFARWLQHYVKIPGYEPLVVMTLIALFAWLAHFVGAPAILGGFAVGMGLSRHFISPLDQYLKNPFPFTKSLENASKPLVHIFTPVFFVYVGISIDLSQLDLSFTGLLILAWLTLLAIVTKLLSGMLASRHWRERIAIGSAMVPRGEVGLVFAEIGRQLNVLAPSEFALLVVIIAITTLIGPLMLKKAILPADTLTQTKGINVKDTK